MSTKIIFRNAAFVCEAPVLVSATYTGTRWDYVLNWTSQGTYYSTFDSITNLHLWVSIDSTPYVDLGAVPFNGVNVSQSLNSLGIDPKTDVKFKLVLTNTGCNNVNSNIITVPAV